MVPADAARRRFLLACVLVVAGCAAAAVADVERPRALAVGGLVAVLAGLVLVIAAEEPYHDLEVLGGADPTPEPEPTPILPEPEPAPEEAPAAPEVVLVSFRLPTSVGAARVHLVGEFNDWSPTRTPMTPSDGWFRVEVPLRAGQSYRYRYLLDGERWENDWAADAYLPNEFGTDDSVVVVPAARPTRQST